MDMSKYAVKNHKVLSSYITLMTLFERGHQAEVVTVKEDMVLAKYWAPTQHGASYCGCFSLCQSMPLPQV